MGYRDPARQRAYQAQWIEARRQKGLEHLGGACALCGSTENLEVDHIDPATKSPALRSLHTGTFWSWSWPRVLAELAKCRALCHDCHEAKSAGEHATGERNGSAKLTDDAVCAIRASSQPSRELSAMYGVSMWTIQYVRRGNGWKHIKVA